MGPDEGTAILSTYRSAAQPAQANAGTEVERAAARPGSPFAADDVFVGSKLLRRRAAQHASVPTDFEFPHGVGHWWMGQDPTRGAEALRQSWESAT